MSEERAASIWSGFDSNEHLVRFIKALSAILLAIVIITATVRYLGLNLRSQEIEINFGGYKSTQGEIERISLEGSGLAIKMSSGQQFANLLVPANKLWVDSGIEVPPGSKVQVMASGSANLSAQLSLNVSNDPASYDLRSFNFLVDPLGRPLNKRTTDTRVADSLRSSLKIRSDAPLGMLLITIVTDRKDLDENPRSGPVITLEEAQDGFTYNSDRAGRVYFCVNDLLASPRIEDRETWLLQRNLSGQKISEIEFMSNIKSAYLKPNATVKQIQDQISSIERRWDAVVAAGYYEAFIEDNSGDFMVSIIVEPASD